MSEAFNPHYGEAIKVADGVYRITAENPSPFTFTGTNSYLIEISDQSVVVIDPGPRLDSHLDALSDTIGPRTVEAVLITHSHRDHTKGLPAFLERFAAPVYAFGPHCLGRPLKVGETNLMAAAADWSFKPTDRVKNFQRLLFSETEFTALFTPGHAGNHMAYALESRDLIFVGDIIMAQSSTIVGPPEGCMSDYLESLLLLQNRAEPLFLPGHGPALETPKQRIVEILAHRQKRENDLKAALSHATDALDIKSLADIIYQQLPTDLMPAARLSLQSQLELLLARGEVEIFGRDIASAHYRLVEGL